MNLEKLTQNDIQDFIHGHKSVDIKELGLKRLPFAPALRTEILQQIGALQKAEKKLPKWATRKGIIFPNADLVEQASSDLTSAYKASIYPQENIQGGVFIDLCAGLGSDALAFSSKFTSVYCVEADPGHAKCLEYNLKILNGKNISVINGYAEKVIQNLPNADLIYIDPQRRTDTGKRGIYDLSQTKPDLLALLPELKKKTTRILIKTSPFLDISEGIHQLGGVTQVHVVETDGQCKEILYYMDTDIQTEQPEIYAVICEPFAKYKGYRRNKPSDTFSDPVSFLFEPGPALMKSDLHAAYAHEYGFAKLAPMTHLYTADILPDPPPKMGRLFEMQSILPVKKEDILKHLPDQKANITIRNFPLKPEDLRKKLGLKDGGEHTIFGCTLFNGSHKLIVCAPLRY